MYLLLLLKRNQANSLQMHCQFFHLSCQILWNVSHTTVNAYTIPVCCIFPVLSFLSYSDTLKYHEWLSSNASGIAESVCDDGMIFMGGHHHNFVLWVSRIPALTADYLQMLSCSFFNFSLGLHAECAWERDRFAEDNSQDSWEATPQSGGHCSHHC